MPPLDLGRLCAAWAPQPALLGREKYVNSAVLLPLVGGADGAYDVVFEVRAAQVRQGGEVCFPGGKIEPGRDADSRQTAVRETAEELGLAPERICVYGALGTLVTALGVAVDAYVGTLDIPGLDALTPEAREVERVFTLPLAWFREHPPQVYHARLEIHPSETDAQGAPVVSFSAQRLGLPERYHRPWGGKIYPIYVYETPEGVIWGITAELLREFVLKLAF